MRYIITTVIAAMLIGLIGCSDDDSNPAEPNSTATPVIPQVTFNGPNTTSQDPNAQIANSYVAIMNAGMLQSAAFSSVAAQQNGNIYTWTYGYQGEIYTFTCTIQSDGSYMWTLKYTGSNLFGTAVTDFMLWEGTTSADGKNGNWTLYTYGYTGKTAELIYTTGANDVITGTWYVYESGGVLESKIIVVNDPDGSGSVEMYSDGVHLYYKAVWTATGSGQWWIYDGAGRETGSGSWT